MAIGSGLVAYVGKICLVDLAGSEDNNLTGNDPQRMREVILSRIPVIPQVEWN